MSDKGEPTGDQQPDGSDAVTGDASRIVRNPGERPCFRHKSHFGILGEAEKVPSALRRLCERLRKEGHDRAVPDVVAYCERFNIDLNG